MAIDGLRHKHDLSLLLKHVNMARSSFYYHLQKSREPDKYELIKKLITQIYHQNKGRYGYRRITLELNNQGIMINHKTVFRLMKSMKLKSLVRIKKYRSYRGSQGKIAPNILQRNFKALKPNQKWATDITEFKVLGEKLYLSPIIDLYNREIISYHISRSPNFKQITTMLDKAFKKHKLNKTLLHSDQGWQYQMKRYQTLLKKNNIIQSMSRKGNCLDNAIIENFFGTLKSELFYLKKWNSINQLEKEIKEYISYYNEKRISSILNGMSPIKYRAQFYK
ncbi:IS3 family transposase [Wenyingzhuangia sp. IMCC45574]